MTKIKENECLKNLYGEVYASFNVCKLAKEVGIDVPARKYYELALTEAIDEETGETTGSFGWAKGELNFQDGFHQNNIEKFDYSSEDWLVCGAYLQSTLVREIRIKFKLNINTIPNWILSYGDKNEKGYDGFTWDVENLAPDYQLVIEEEHNVGYEEYEDALDVALLKTLQYIEKNNL